MQRYFIDNENINYNLKQAYITGSDFHHIKNVMRMHKGDKFYIVDKCENVFLVMISDFLNSEVVCELLEKIERNVELSTNVVIAHGLVRREKSEEVLRRIAELGAYGYVQVSMERSVVKVKKNKDSKIDRMKLIVKEACEQCHRNHLMDVYNVHSFDEFIYNFRDYAVKLFAYEEAGRNNNYKLKEAILASKNKNIVVIIGPEGGISEKEVKLLELNGFISVGLGPRILRTETAPLYVMSAISYELELGDNRE